MMERMSRDATRQRILDTAERHFALHGFSGTSLRAITRDARVNVAAIHYHYGSKETLLSATMERIVAPVNAERLRLLDEAIRAADGAPSVEAILSAFLCPDLILIRDLGDRGVMMARFSGRSATEPGEVVVRVLRGLYGDLGDRFIDALAIAVPDVPRDQLAWRLRCVVAIITYLLSNTGTGLALLDADDIDGTAERLVAFLAPAIRSAVPTAGSVADVALAMAGGTAR
jgi:AcrR family transcriptional regulator